MQRLNKINRLLHREVEILEMEQNIQRRVQENMTQNQKDAFLREQVRVIQEELREGLGQRDHRLPPPDHGGQAAGRGDQ